MHAWQNTVHLRAHKSAHLERWIYACMLVQLNCWEVWELAPRRLSKHLRHTVSTLIIPKPIGPTGEWQPGV